MHSFYLLFELRFEAQQLQIEILWTFVRTLSKYFFVPSRLVSFFNFLISSDWAWQRKSRRHQFRILYDNLNKINISKIWTFLWSLTLQPDDEVPSNAMPSQYQELWNNCNMDYWDFHRDYANFASFKSFSIGDCQTSKFVISDMYFSQASEGFSFNRSMLQTRWFVFVVFPFYVLNQPKGPKR